MKLKKIYVEITNSCNLSCKFCIKNKRNIEFITLENYKKILEKIDNYTDYIYMHVLGEPLLHPNINELINLTKTKNKKVNLTTNGYLINRIKNNKNIRQINISLHSFDLKYNISLNDYLNNIYDAIDTLIDNGVYVSLRIWVKSKYTNEIIKSINKKYNVEINLENLNITLKPNLFISNNEEFIWPDLNNNYYNEKGRCYGLKDHIGILVDGTIIPCCLDSLGIINLGNIYENNLENILNQDRVKNMQKGFKNNYKCEELCKHCKYL